MFALGQLEARYRRMRRVLRTTTAATLSNLMRSVSAQQLLAAKYVQRKIAVRTVVAMEEAALLLAIQWVVGGIKIQHELLGSGLEAGDELIHQHLVLFAMRWPGRPTSAGDIGWGRCPPHGLRQ
jgi:hypothetical protein